MDNRTKAKIALSIYALCVFGCVLYLLYRIVGYDLGLKKPNFKKGDCIVWTEGEFGKVISKKLIIRVGKTDYQFQGIYDNLLGDPDSEKFLYIDDKYVKTECNLPGELN